MPETEDLLRNPARLAALRRTALLDSPPEEAFDRLTRLACRLLEAPTALVSLVDDERQFFKSCVGLGEPWASRRETPLTHSFCQHAVRSGEPLIVSDARRHPLVQDNLAIAELDVIAYAGIPLIDSTGQALGSFCVVDSRPREWTPQELSALGDLAASVLTEIELRLALERERASSRRYRATISQAGVGICEVDLAGRFLEVNERFCEITDYSREELLSMSFQEITHPDDVPEDAELYRRLQAGELDYYTLEKRYVRKDQTILPIRLAASVVRDDDGVPSYGVGVVEDITDRRRMETLLDGQKGVLELIAQSAPLAVVLGALVGILEEHFAHAVTGGILLLDADGLHLGRGVGPSLPESYHQAVEGLRIAPDLGTCAAAAARGEVVITPDLANDPAWADLRELPLGLGLRSCWSQPIQSYDGRVLGTFGTYFRECRRPTDEERRIVDILSRTAALAIERNRHEELRAELLAAERDARGRAEAAERRYRDLVDGLDAIVWEADIESWDFHFVSQRAEGILGYPSALWLESADFWIEIIHPDDRESVVAQCRQACDEGRNLDFEYRVLAADGRVVWLRDLVYVVKGQHGRAGRVRGVMIDVTETKRLENELQRRADELTESDRRKDQFLATLAHELRNPLAPISNAVELMRAERGDPARIEELGDMMARQVKQLIRLIDDLMDVSRISRGKITLRKEPLELDRVIDEAIESVRARIDEAGHRLTVRRAPRPLKLLGDPVRLTQAVINLLHNAAKYTPEQGEIELITEHDQGEAVVRVRDNGVGIPPDELGRIFDMFTQVDASLDRSRGGLGIGLTLVKNLVEIHGGGVTAHSAGRGKGSEFVLRLPLAVEAESKRIDAPSPALPGEHANGLEKRAFRVLVVDDTRAVAEMFAMMLRILGHHVDTASDGGAALARIDARRPDLVFSDISMPGMDGYELARRLRSNPQWRDLYLVAMTGYGQAEDRQRTLEAGFDCHMVKPAELDDLHVVFDAFTAENSGDGRPPHSDRLTFRR